jgi:hypothetical protein
MEPFDQIMKNLLLDIPEVCRPGRQKFNENYFLQMPNEWNKLRN